MSAHLRYKLQALEITPPASAWRNIEARLDAEFDASDIGLATKLYDLEITPPANTFENILGRLTPEEKKPAKVIALPFKRVAVAAAAIAVIITSVILWNSKNSNNQLSQKQNTVTVNTVSGNNEKPSTAAVSPENKPSKTLLPVRSSLAQNNTSSKRNPVRFAYNQKLSNNPVKSSVSADITSVNADSKTKDISVAAPPIRDENGEIIMDVDLITSPDNNYITVTGPNGEQTKISTKFLPLLSYLNTGASNDYRTGFLIQESSLWKIRFQEWRNKMQQASFFPSGNNFFGIVELKEMIEEQRSNKQ